MNIKKYPFLQWVTTLKKKKNIKSDYTIKCSTLLKTTFNIIAQTNVISLFLKEQNYFESLNLPFIILQRVK